MQVNTTLLSGTNARKAGRGAMGAFVLLLFVTITIASIVIIVGCIVGAIIQLIKKRNKGAKE